MVHHNFKKGTKVLVILKDKTKIIDKYHSSKGHYLILENNIIHWKNIRSSTIFKRKEEVQ